MHKLLIATSVALFGVSASAAVAGGHGEKCFDKATLTYKECPTAAAPAPEPAPEPLHDWTGLYVGAHAGYGWFNNDVEVSPLTGFGALFAAGALPSSLDYSADGALLGGQIGYNHQIDELVLGVEADIAWSGIDGSESASGAITTAVVGTTSTAVVAPTVINTPLGIRSETEIDWLSTLRLRGGYTVTPEALLFITGGLAIADVERTDVISVDGVDAWGFNESDIRYGWTLGGGLEYALDSNWSVKAEYLYVDLGGEDYTLDPLVAATTTCCTSDDDLTGHIARIGVNYKF